MMVPFACAVAFLTALVGSAALLRGRRVENLGSVSAQWLMEHQQRGAA